MNEKERKILQEAQTRFELCSAWEGSARARFLEDVKFANADPDNGYQWPTNVLQSRQLDAKPCLTINKVRQHCLQIMNDMLQNPTSVKVLATGEGASEESAEVFQDVIRRIEYNSNAQSAYQTADKFQIQGGIGYYYVCTDYIDNETFDQEIFIRPINDPMQVMIDPNIQQQDGSDARFAFVYSDVPRDRFKIEYPKFADKVADGFANTMGNWIGKDTVRVAEYYRVKEKKVKLVAYTFTNPETGREEQKLVRADELPPEIRAPLLAEQGTRTRPILERIVEWYKIVGDEIVDQTIIPCPYIPIVRQVGEETIINGLLDRKGHVRAMKDAQRMFNYFYSAATEFAGIQSNSPYIGPLEAFEGLENTWKNANVMRPVFLPYNGFDDQGNPIAKPERQAPPMPSEAYMQAMIMANEEIQSASGQRDAVLGQAVNDQSGQAINALQRKGENSTYHYINNAQVAKRFLGKILLAMIPRVYDTERLIKIRSEDGEETTIKIDPKAKTALNKETNEREAEAAAIFNPSVGKYEVMAAVGPAYETRRRETFNALTQILSYNKELTPIVGDLLFKSGDFAMADDIAERLRRMVPPQALGDGPSEQEQQLQAQNEQLTQTLTDTLQALADKSKEHEIEEQQKQIDVYEAISKRIDVLLKNQQQDQTALATVVAQTVIQALTKGLPQPMEAEHAEPDIGAPDPTAMSPEQPMQAQPFDPMAQI